MIIFGDILHIITSNIFFNYDRVIFIEKDYRQDFVDVNEDNKIILKLKIVVNRNHFLFENIFNDIIIEEKKFLIVENIQLFFFLTSLGEHLIVHVD